MDKSSFTSVYGISNSINGIILQDGIACGDFRPVNVKMAVFGLLGMLNWTHQWFSPAGKLSSQEIAATLADLALHGLVV